MNRSFCISLALILLIAVASIEAKCPVVEYIVQGRVVEKKSGKPMRKVQVLIFLEDQDEPTYASVKTAKNGRFKAEIPFDTFRKMNLLGGHVCDRTLQRVDITLGIGGLTLLLKTTSMQFVSLLNWAQM